jgi:hypothetical protein
VFEHSSSVGIGSEFHAEWYLELPWSEKPNAWSRFFLTTEKKETVRKVAQVDHRMVIMIIPLASVLAYWYFFTWSFLYMQTFPRFVANGIVFVGIVGFYDGSHTAKRYMPRTGKHLLTWKQSDNVNLLRQWSFIQTPTHNSFPISSKGFSTSPVH